MIDPRSIPENVDFGFFRMAVAEHGAAIGILIIRPDVSINGAVCRQVEIAGKKLIVFGK